MTGSKITADYPVAPGCCRCCGYPVTFPETDEDGTVLPDQVHRSCWIEEETRPAPSVANPSRMERVE